MEGPITQCSDRATSLGDRDELVCSKLAVVTPGNRLPIEETSDGCCSPSCIVHNGNPLGHHALTCKSGGDSIFRHNSLRDAFWESCKLACIAGQIEAGSGLDVEGSRTRPADILLPNWEFGKPAALDFTITSALNPSTLNEASVMAGSAASAAEVRKHVANDEKCSRLGWVCIPLSVETYGCWGEEAGRCLDRLATRIATRTGCPKSSAVSGLYGRLSIGLVRANARALLASEGDCCVEEGGGADAGMIVSDNTDGAEYVCKGSTNEASAGAMVIARKPIVPFAEIGDLVDSTNYTDARTQACFRRFTARGFLTAPPTKTTYVAIAENFPVLAGLLQAQLGAVEDSAAPSCILKSWMSQHQLHAMQARDLGYSIQLPVN
ncbi:hypothetical protein EMCRGX_G018321 [Ephydatia muelleri]